MEITKLGLLLDLHEYYTFQLTQHAADFMLTASKPGHEQHFNDSKQRLNIIDGFIAEQEGE
jgi:hypothetical protein